MKKVLIILIALITLTGCSLPGLGGNARKNNIVVASGNTTERQILTELVKQMVEHHMPNQKVSTINNLGSTILIVQTLSRRDANIAGGMYTGTSLTGELGLEPTSDPQKALEQVVEGYSEKFDMVWFPSYGFANTYAFMVTEEFSKKNNVTKVSDLKSLAPDLRAGVDTGWMARQGDGYEAFKEVYGFDFGNLYPMEIGLVYNALRVNEMDVVLGYSTDGRIASNNLVVLEDDLRLFPPYDASPVISKELLEEYPELEEILLRLEGEVLQETMQKLNERSDDEKIEPKIVAQEFLEAHNYFEDKEIVPLKERSLYQKILEVK